MMGIESSQTPLERKVYNAHFDRLFATGTLNPEILEHCDSYQQYALNEVKKALVRLSNKT